MEFNILIIGSKGVGKSSFINRSVNGKFTSNDVNICKVKHQTNLGEITCNIYDSSCTEKVDGVIIMFDLLNNQTFFDVIKYKSYVKSMFGEIPIVVCGNKADQTIKIKTSYITKFIYYNTDISYVDISAKSMYNYEKPFIFLYRKLLSSKQLSHQELGEHDLHLVEISTTV